MTVTEGERRRVGIGVEFTVEYDNLGSGDREVLIIVEEKSKHKDTGVTQVLPTSLIAAAVLGASVGDRRDYQFEDPGTKQKVNQSVWVVEIDGE